MGLCGLVDYVDKHVSMTVFILKKPKVMNIILLTNYCPKSFSPMVYTSPAPMVTLMLGRVPRVTR